MSQPTTYRNALPLGTQLQEYRLDGVLGAGAFGMTYLAWDTHLEKKVALKEYLPTEFAVRALDGSVVPITTDSQHDYRWGLDRFLLEARTLARFSHPNIVRVNRYFESHGTAYVVMDYEEGDSLSQVLKASSPPSEADLLKITLPLLDGLQAVHEAGFLHRDIKPANVFIRKNGSPVLLDFGAARQALGGATKSLTAVLTPGYAPLEQYSSDGNQGPWTDIYALGGVLYRALMKENPPDATVRIRSDVVPGKLRAMRGQVGVFLLSAIDWALTLDEKHRPQTVKEWRDAIEKQAAAAQPVAHRPSPAPRPAVVAMPAPVPPKPPAPLPVAAAVVRSPLAAAAEAAPAATPVSARLPRRTSPPPGPILSLNVGWLVLAVVLVVGAVWATRTRDRPAPAASPVGQSLTVQTASGTVTLPGTIVSVRPQGSGHASSSLPAPTQVMLRVPEQASPAQAPSEHVAALDSRPLQPPSGEIAAKQPSSAATNASEPSQPPVQSGPRHEAMPNDHAPARETEAGRYAPPKPLVERIFGDADVNRDGYVSRDEAHRFGPLARNFERMDVDGDGRISAAEFQRARPAIPPPPPPYFKK